MRECKCGATFETLSAYRLHQRDECTYSEEVSVEGMDLDGIAERMTEEILICDVCEQSNDELERIKQDNTSGNIAITGKFQCEHCGATNQNTAIIE